MDAMPLNLSATDFALRLALTVLAGGMIGFNRGEHGRPAGLRTTLLVCLAASASMIQANLLLPTVHRSPDSFIMMDLMRLPLGILSGMGFIGAGAILRRDDRVQGVTTAATLWYVTVMGLCIGGGQLILGMILAVVGMLVLSVLKRVERYWLLQSPSRLVLVIDEEGPSEEEVRSALTAAGFEIQSVALAYSAVSRRTRLNCEIRWTLHATGASPPSVLERLAARPGVRKLYWRP